MLILREQKAIDIACRRLRDKKDKAITKIIRLNKQKKLLNKRERKMISTSLESINKLKALKEKEEKERLTAEKSPQATKAEVLEFDPNFDYSSFDPFAQLEHNTTLII